MILRLGKTLRHKDSFANNDETKQDIINNLPDSLLTDILSLLRDYDVKQTRLVSKRWKNLFAFLPNFRFTFRSYMSLEQVKNMHVFVDQTLAIRGDMPIERLFLRSQYNCDYDCFYDILCTLVRFKAGVRELELMFPLLSKDRNRNRNKVVKLCWDLFKTWDSLVVLTLYGEFVLDVPNVEEFLFPCLKKISLTCIKYASEESVVNLISNCPVLEELHVGRNAEVDRLGVFNISSLSLKRLTMRSSPLTGDYIYKVVIDAPKLEYIYIYDYLTDQYSLRKPLLSLVEADIHHSSRVISQFIPFLSSAKILTLTPRSAWVLNHVRALNMPMFPNLVRLVIGWAIEFLPVWLNNMPNLEHITLSYPNRNNMPFLYGMSTLLPTLPEEPPVCLRFKMKEIVVRIDRSLTKEEFTFIKYLLKNSISLENFRIYALHIDRERREQLLNFHLGSECCQIEFI